MSLDNYYQEMFDAGSGDDIDWKLYHFKVQALIESLVIDNEIKSFHIIAQQDLNSNLYMSPWFRLLGYSLAVKDEPSNIDYLSGLIQTLELYYSEDQERIKALYVRLEALK